MVTTSPCAGHPDCPHPRPDHCAVIEAEEADMEWVQTAYRDASASTFPCHSNDCFADSLHAINELESSGGHGSPETQLELFAKDRGCHFSE